jgi:hypothetical protein
LAETEGLSSTLPADKTIDFYLSRVQHNKPIKDLLAMMWLLQQQLGDNFSGKDTLGSLIDKLVASGESSLDKKTERIGTANEQP